MKKNIFYYMLFMLLVLTGCGEEHDDVRPGLYVQQESIETFPGDAVLVTGTISNYVGLSSLTISCSDWEIEKKYDLDGQRPTVFNYNYQMVVPEMATFPQELLLVVVDKNGLQNQKSISLNFLPDTTAPTIAEGPGNQVSVNYDAESKKALWDVTLKLVDDRSLKSVHISIPDAGVNKTVSLEGKTATITETIEFMAIGQFPATFTVSDGSNETVLSTEVVVMVPEIENPIQDYLQMYIVDASENPDDYINGYYRYMDRQGEYQYRGRFYAADDNALIFFTPTKSLDGDLYGVSPYVSTKLMNNNGYVIPVTLPKKGYYEISIDLNAHSISYWELEIPSSACTEPIWLSGTGFSFGDWAASDEMTKTDTYRYKVETEVVKSSGEYYFYTANWVRVFRADAAGQWWYEAASGSCAAYSAGDYTGKVKVIYDTALPWGIIKKMKE